MPPITGHNFESCLILISDLSEVLVLTSPDKRRKEEGQYLLIHQRIVTVLRVLRELKESKFCVINQSIDAFFRSSHIIQRKTLHERQETCQIMEKGDAME